MTGTPSLDEPGQPRSSEIISDEVLKETLRVAVPDRYEGGPVALKQFAGGASNLTYLVSFGEHELILRRPPFGTKAKSAHDMGREFRVLTALQPYYPYCPKPVAEGDETSPLGVPFYLMERIRGVILRRDFEQPISPDAARALAFELMDKHIALHAIDTAGTKLADLGKPQGYVRRQIEGWSERYRRAVTDDAPNADQVMAWLTQSMPAESGKASVIHNDYKFDNVIFDAEDGKRIVGVLDWEMATLGDPLMDLGASLAYWVEPGDPDVFQMARLVPTNAPGMPSRAEIIDYYSEKSGLTLNDPRFYFVYGLFRLAVVAQQLYYRYAKGQTDNPKFAHFKPVVTGLLDMCLTQMEKA
ncbi:MAG: phosphotransferase family protein [Pseudomonadota bacterium]